MALDEKFGGLGSENNVRRRRVTAVTSSEEFSSTRRTSSERQIHSSNEFHSSRKRRGRAGLRRNGKYLELALALRGELNKISRGGSEDCRASAALPGSVQ